jgi:Cu+-exporting ATPase
MASLRLAISGMHCSHCRAKVEKALTAVPGVFGATVDLPGGSAEIDLDDRSVRPEQLIEAVRTAGYSATVAG